METMKKVNVIASRPIYEINPPIRTRARNIKLTIPDIRKCIMAHARVEEVLRDGSTIILHLGNYNKDNQPPKKVKVEPEITEEPEEEVVEPEEFEEETESEINTEENVTIEIEDTIETDDSTETQIEDEDTFENIEEPEGE